MFVVCRGRAWLRIYTEVAWAELRDPLLPWVAHHNGEEGDMDNGDDGQDVFTLTALAPPRTPQDPPIDP